MTTESTIKPRILVVDDDPGIRMAIRSILENEYTIVESASVKESLEIFDKEQPDLITLDIQLPEVDGMQGLSSFRRRSGRVPIILISGYRTFELAREALRLGANDYLTKPFSVQELRDTVKSALTRVRPVDDLDADAAKAASNFTVRLPLQDLMDDRFLSSQHRSYFLAFAQNAFSDKKRTFEEIAVQELIKSITIQFDGLNLKKEVDYVIPHVSHKLRLKCDMYLLAGALANLTATCLLETRTNKSPVEIVFEEHGQKLQVLIRKKGANLSAHSLAAFEHWHKQPQATLDPNTTILILVEKAVNVHYGEFIVGSASPSGRLVEITLPGLQTKE
jgi:DNA-binding response OmpR family regulator